MRISQQVSAVVELYRDRGELEPPFTVCRKVIREGGLLPRTDDAAPPQAKVYRRVGRHLDSVTRGKLTHARNLDHVRVAQQVIVVVEHDVDVQVAVTNVAYAIIVGVGLVRVVRARAVVVAVRHTVAVRVRVWHAAAASAGFGLARIVRALVLAIEHTVAVRVRVWHAAAASAGFGLARIVRALVAAIGHAVAISVHLVVITGADVSIVTHPVPVAISAFARAQILGAVAIAVGRAVMLARDRGRVHVLALDSHKGTNHAHKGLVSRQLGRNRALAGDFSVKIRVAESDVRQRAVSVDNDKLEPDRRAARRHLGARRRVGVVPGCLVIYRDVLFNVNGILWSAKVIVAKGYDLVFADRQIKDLVEPSVHGIVKFNRIPAGAARLPGLVQPWLQVVKVGVALCVGHALGQQDRGAARNILIDAHLPLGHVLFARVLDAVAVEVVELVDDDVAGCLGVGKDALDRLTGFDLEGSAGRVQVAAAVVVVAVNAGQVPTRRNRLLRGVGSRQQVADHNLLVVCDASAGVTAKAKAVG